jgi:Ca2+-binding EF-hand superfamily protein
VSGPGVDPATPSYATPSAQGAAPKRGRSPKNKSSKPVPDAANKTSRADHYFAICDQNGDNWISFSEAQETLGLDHAGFAAYDEDVDGRILRDEFRRRYFAIIDAGGAFAPPKTKTIAPAALPATVDKLLESFDKNRDGALDGAELDVALVEMGAARMDPEATLDQFDHDGSLELEPPEVEELLALLKPGSSTHRGPPPKSIDELFGKVIPRLAGESGTPSTPEPPRISGPVSSFRRLDIDGDGHVSIDELNELQRPFTFAVRPAAVLAALDTDGDGTISAAEFRAAMGSVR